MIIFIILIEFVTILFMSFFFFCHKACGILAPRPLMQLAPSVLEGKVLTSGPPGKSLLDFCIRFYVEATTRKGMKRKERENYGLAKERKEKRQEFSAG